MNVNSCQTCGQPMSKTPETMNFDCGGDCLYCMARYGDPDAIEAIERLAGKKVNVWGSLYSSSEAKGRS